MALTILRIGNLESLTAELIEVEMAKYEVWATNAPFEWTQLRLETDDREKAMNKAHEILEKGRFRFIAVDHNGTTIWSNDPETPATSE